MSFQKTAKGWVTECLFVIVGTVLLGCTPSRNADFVSNTWTPDDLDEVVVGPHIDVRFDKSVEIDPELASGPCVFCKSMAYIFEYITDYEARYDPEIGWPPGLSEDVFLPPYETLKSIMPQGADRWVLLLVLYDVVEKEGLGTAYSADCEGMLFDRNTSNLVWRDRAGVDASFDLLTGMFVPGGVAANVAVTDCFRETFLAFPRR